MVDYYKGTSILQEGGFEFTSKAETGSKAVGWLWIDPAGYADSEKSGGKIHLSVDPRRMADAWKIVVEEMIKDKASYLSARAVAPDAVNVLANPNHPHAGKMITLFTNANFNDENAVKYRHLLKRIDKRLQANGIGPGPEVKGERKMLDTHYISYRGSLSEIFTAAVPHNKGMPQAEAPQASASQVPLQIGRLTWKEEKENPSNDIHNMHTIVDNKDSAIRLRDDLSSLGINAKIYNFTDHVRVQVSGNGIEAVKELQKLARQGIRPGNLQRGASRPHQGPRRH